MLYRDARESSGLIWGDLGGSLRCHEAGWQESGDGDGDVGTHEEMNTHESGGHAPSKVG
jgi:hypothetical protein